MNYRGNALILITGSEIAGGRVMDKNTPYLAEQLRSSNFSISGWMVLSDDDKHIESSVQHLLQQPEIDLIIMTGGLGPTTDDLTVDILSKVFQRPIEFDEKTISYLKKKYGSSFREIMRRQARYLQGSEVLHNSRGCAPGFVIRYEKTATTLVALPGVPGEMKKMFERELKPKLLNYFSLKESLFRRQIYLYRIPEARVEQEFFHQLSKEGILQDYTICASTAVICIELVCHTESAIEEITNAIAKKFPEHYCPQTAQKQLVEILNQRKLSIASAESCTVGQVAADLCEFSGASKYYRGSIIAYRNDIKKQMLDVQQIDRDGAVSATTAVEMAKNVCQRFDTDIGLSVTGIAGPTSDQPDLAVGTFFVGFALSEKCFSNKSSSSSANMNTWVYQGSWVTNERNVFRKALANTTIFQTVSLLQRRRLAQI